MIIRPIQHQDLEALRAIARESGPGFTSLVDDPDFLRRKIALSIDSFARSPRTPDDEHYLFVLVDENSGRVMGTTAIEARAGQDRPLFHFRHSAGALGTADEPDQLIRCNHYTGCSEICSLYLRPGDRRPQAGKLLSKVRFLFMAQHPQRFEDTVIAEMRGVSDEHGQSPFWNGLRAQAGNLDFATVTRLAGTGDTRLLDKLLPGGSLCTASIGEQARRVIGEVHERTRPALKMLTDEGFRYTGYVDLFDAGPTVESPLAGIASIQGSEACRVQVVDDNVPAITRNRPGHLNQALLLTNGGVRDFRATITHGATWLPHHRLLSVPRSLAGKLMLETGSVARCLALAPTADQKQPRRHSPLLEARYAH
ncbi:arginine N-succinyltransferase [Marinobacter sp. M-5]|uniref:arginine N-succinyltransferase n=1 Tax=Marinobacter sp. M-5 TaxID=3081089 RepID=UPI00293CB10E|nr:arginine N-succinyltransferase [Marinobacter sp. M-5]MDV3502848.1 arginine N-succinyltransferase [Marinobacter sp. M-5]